MNRFRTLLEDADLVGLEVASYTVVASSLAFFWIITT